MSVSVVIPHAAGTVGEGPHWEPESQSLLYVDIGAGDIHKYNTITQLDEKIHFDSTIGFVVPRKQGGYITGSGNKLVTFDWVSKDVTQVLYECKMDEENPVRFNDGKCDSSGRLWAGTMGYEPVPGIGPTGAYGALYSLDAHHVAYQHIADITISNGLAWSADNSRMFYIDSGPRHIYSFNYDMDSNKLSDQKVLLDMSEATIPDLGFPDGMCIDVNDQLWVACYAANKVIQVDIETGKILRKVLIPGADRITSCCFGGTNYDELFVTSAKDGVTEAEFQSTQPQAGSIFKVTGLGTKGLPAPVYNG